MAGNKLLSSHLKHSHAHSHTCPHTHTRTVGTANAGHEWKVNGEKRKLLFSTLLGKMGKVLNTFCLCTFSAFPQLFSANCCAIRRQIRMWKRWIDGELGSSLLKGVEGIGSGEKKEKVRGSGSWKREAEFEESEATRGIGDKCDKFAVGRRKERRKLKGKESKERKVEGGVVGSRDQRKLESKLVDVSLTNL